MLLRKHLIAALNVLCDRIDAFRDRMKEGDYQLEIDLNDIEKRIDPSFHVDDVTLIEYTDNLGDRVSLADICKKFVSKTLPFRSALYQSCDIDELNDGGDRLFLMRKFRKLTQSRIGKNDYSDRGIDGTERIISGLCSPFSEGIKKRRFTDVRKPDDTYG